MTETDLKDRYDSFQKHAVEAILNDFSQKKNGRYLLVIPTGGGKTFTAVKAICRLFDDGILNADTDQVLWTAHRQELITQAEKTFKKFLSDNSSVLDIKKNVIIEMLSRAAVLIKDKKIVLVVIDEAHHGAANSYKAFFEKTSLGILGLTATPSRHDGKPLEFERESFSIGFPDLVKKGLIIKPEIKCLDGGAYGFHSFEDEDLEKLNNKSRNNKIIKELTSNADKYNKVIIFVGTMKHAEDLYQVLSKTDLRENYESIAYITGKNNSRNQSQDDFVETEKQYKRSILVNVQKLSEGYDDPALDTVVMATPSRSKLYYMQALGRVVRKNPDNPLKKANVIEVVDDLPNIRYRIDNRWLYADISDTLEPQVEDRVFSSEAEFREAVKAVYEENNTTNEYRAIPDYNEHYRYTMILFKHYVGAKIYECFPIILTNENRTSVGNMFNFISERMEVFRKKQVYFEAVFKMLGRDGIDLIPDESHRRLIFDAMNNASNICTSRDVAKDVTSFVREGYPWLKFVAFNYRENENQLNSELEEFIREMVNKDEIHELLVTKNYEPGAILIRLPMPLCFYVGKILTRPEFEVIKSILMMLENIKNSETVMNQYQDVNTILDKSVLPIETMYSRSLALIVRDTITYSIELP